MKAWIARCTTCPWWYRDNDEQRTLGAGLIHEMLEDEHLVEDPVPDGEWS